MSSIDKPESLAQLVDRLGRLHPDTPRRWGTMTSGEMLCHLGDVSSNVLRGGRSGKSKARPIFKWIALYTPVPWPHGLPTPARVNPRAEGTRPGHFEKDRQRVLEGLRALASASSFPPDHTVFGPMNTRDWRVWVYRHTHHHLRQFGL